MRRAGGGEAGRRRGCDDGYGGAAPTPLLVDSTTVLVGRLDPAAGSPDLALARTDLAPVSNGGGGAWMGSTGPKMGSLGLSTFFLFF